MVKSVDLDHHCAHTCLHTMQHSSGPAFSSDSDVVGGVDAGFFERERLRLIQDIAKVSFVAFFPAIAMEPPSTLLGEPCMGFLGVGACVVETY